MNLRETQERLRDEREDRRSCHRADSLEVRLEEARAEHARVRLHVETQELRKGDQLFIERDRELAEVRSQLAELVEASVAHEVQTH